jgi:hypothetical protein
MYVGARGQARRIGDECVKFVACSELLGMQMIRARGTVIDLAYLQRINYLCTELPGNCV